MNRKEREMAKITVCATLLYNTCIRVCRWRFSLSGHLREKVELFILFIPLFRDCLKGERESVGMRLILYFPGVNVSH